MTETNMVNYALLPDQIGLQNGGAFRVTWANGSDNSETVGDDFGQSNMLGRSARIRYESTNIAGCTASASIKASMQPLLKSRCVTAITSLIVMEWSSTSAASMR